MPWLLLLITLFSVQDHHRGMNERGAMVMGFDQQNTSHHFTYTAMVAPSDRGHSLVPYKGRFPEYCTHPESARKEGRPKD